MTPIQSIYGNNEEQITRGAQNVTVESKKYSP